VETQGQSWVAQYGGIPQTWRLRSSGHDLLVWVKGMAGKWMVEGGGTPQTWKHNTGVAFACLGCGKPPRHKECDLGCRGWREGPQTTLSMVWSGLMQTEVQTELNPQVLGLILCEGGPDPYLQVQGPSLSGLDLGVKPDSDLVWTSKEVTEVTLADASLCHICHITQRQPTPWTGWQQQLQLQLPMPTTTTMTTAAPAAATANEDNNNNCCSCHHWRGQQQLHLQLPVPMRTMTITAAAAAATIDENEDEDNNNGRRGCPPPHHWFERTNEEGLSPSGKCVSDTGLNKMP